VKFAEQNSRFLPFLGGVCMGGTLRMSNFKILSLRDIKFAENTTGVKISAFIGTELVSRQISAMATATERDRRKFFSRSNYVFKP
jgi:hypothetical protein